MKVVSAAVRRDFVFHFWVATGINRVDSYNHARFSSPEYFSFIHFRSVSWSNSFPKCTKTFACYLQFLGLWTKIFQTIEIDGRLYTCTLVQLYTWCNVNEQYVLHGVTYLRYFNNSILFRKQWTSAFGAKYIFLCVKDLNVQWNVPANTTSIIIN